MSRFPPTGPIKMGDLYNYRTIGLPETYSFGQSQSNISPNNTTDYGNVSSMTAITPGGYMAHAVYAPGAFAERVFNTNNRSSASLTTETYKLSEFRGKGAIYGIRNLGYFTAFPYARANTDNGTQTTYGTAADIFSGTYWDATSGCNFYEYHTMSYSLGYSRLALLWRIWNTSKTTLSSFRTWLGNLATDGFFNGEYLEAECSAIAIIVSSNSSGSVQAERFMQSPYTSTTTGGSYTFATTLSTQANLNLNSSFCGKAFNSSRAQGYQGSSITNPTGSSFSSFTPNTDSGGSITGTSGAYYVNFWLLYGTSTSTEWPYYIGVPSGSTTGTNAGSIYFLG